MMPMPRKRTPGRAGARAASTAGGVAGNPDVEPAVGASGAGCPPGLARNATERTHLDLVQLNLAYLHVARELSRSSRELAITRLGLDAEACAALDRLSVEDLHVLANSQGLLFTLRIDAVALMETARLARVDHAAFESRLLLSRPRT
jgi:hypothetical protein